MKSGKFKEVDYMFPNKDSLAEKLRRKWDQKDKKYSKYYFKKQRARLGEFNQGPGEKLFETDFTREGLKDDGEYQHHKVNKYSKEQKRQAKLARIEQLQRRAKLQEKLIKDGININLEHLD